MKKVLVLLMVLVFCAACESAVEVKTTPTPELTHIYAPLPSPGEVIAPKPTPNQADVIASSAVAYEITGSASSVSVTLSNPTGGTEQYSHVTVPYTYSYSSFPNHFLYISAQNLGQYGSVTVTIYVNGQAYKTSTSSGAYVIATADGMK